MADDDNSDADSIDRDDSIRHGSEDAREAAKEKMKEAIEDDKNEEEIHIDPEGASAIKGDIDIPDGAQPKHDNKKLIQQLDEENLNLKKVKIYSPFKIYFEGAAKSVSAVNKTGSFDILPGHKNFMTLLTACELQVRTERGEEKLKIETAVMHVHDNTIRIFLDV